jgi:tRNA 2-selenouridine synthase
LHFSAIFVGMPVSRVAINEFLQLGTRMPILDVRSPGEYSHAHIPGAKPLPLFSDEERRIIGTAYKQESRERAIKIGLEAFGKKMVPLVEAAEAATKASREVAIHCWRGGMRSGAVAWLLDLYGFRVFTLAGGYKSYRHHAIEVLGRKWELNILGGYTGGNKTGLIHRMIAHGMRVIDLEGIAGHKGSAFGNLEQRPQPSQEMFENLLAHALETLPEGDSPVWLEAESQRLGLVNIPNDFFLRMRASTLYFLDIPFNERLAHIIKEYGSFPKEQLLNAIGRITKKLGGLETKMAVSALVENDVPACFAIILKYYDKLYRRTMKEPSPKGEDPDARSIVHIESATTDAAANLDRIITHAGKSI